MSQVKGLSRNRCRNKEKSLSFGYNKLQRISIFNVLREARSNGRTFVAELE